jgi:mono/diheme cytochrome c family protein
MVNETRTRRSYWLLWSILVPLAVFFTAAGAMSIPPDTQGVDIVAGRDLFRAHCGSCHFAKVGFPAHHGPNLYDIGRSGASRKPPLTSAQYILESILDPGAMIAPSSRPGMPPNIIAQLTPEEVRNIVGFLASCGAYPDYGEIKRLEIPDRRTAHESVMVVSLEKMTTAEHVLRDKGACLQCHSVHSVPEYTTYAPGIFGVGLTDRQALRQSLIEPHKVVKPNYGSVNVVLSSGETLSGRLMKQHADRLVLCTRDDKNRTVVRDVALEDVAWEDGRPLIEKSDQSIMPTGFDKLLSAEEIDALLTLIGQLN